MSSRLRRSQSLYNLDYAVLHDSGEKILKSVNMDLERLRVKEKQIRGDLTENLRLYDLEELETVDDVMEGLDHVTEIGKSYRHVHVELENVLGEVDYLGAYPKAGELTEKVRSYQTSAKAKSRRLRHLEGEANAARAVAERQRLESQAKVEALEVEVQVFQGKLEDEITNYISDEVEEIRHSSKRFESLLDECYSLLGKAKVVFKDTFDNKYKPIFDDSMKKIREHIKTNMAKMSDIASKERKALAEKEAKDVKLVNDKFLAEQTPQRRLSFVHKTNRI